MCVDQGEEEEEVLGWEAEEKEARSTKWVEFDADWERSGSGEVGEDDENEEEL